MKQILLVTVTIVALAIGEPAIAADLQRIPIKAAPPIAVANWTGCYIGLNGGWSWGSSNFVSGIGDPDIITQGFPTPNATLGGLPGFRVNSDIDGGIFGGHAGCQYQWSNWVLGVEASGDWTNIRGSTTATTGFPPSPLVVQNRFDTKVKWLATATARLGYAWNNWLLYAKGGLAAGQQDIRITRVSVPLPNFFVTDEESRVGWTVGAGVEWMFAPNWIFGVEYNYIDLGSASFTEVAHNPAGVPVLPFTFVESNRLQINEVVGRISYKF
jgi:outer membrane immunogenic protein